MLNPRGMLRGRTLAELAGATPTRSRGWPPAPLPHRPSIGRSVRSCPASLRPAGPARELRRVRSRGWRRSCAAPASRASPSPRHFRSAEARVSRQLCDTPACSGDCAAVPRSGASRWTRRCSSAARSLQSHRGRRARDARPGRRGAPGLCRMGIPCRWRR